MYAVVLVLPCAMHAKTSGAPPPFSRRFYDAISFFCVARHSANQSDLHTYTHTYTQNRHQQQQLRAAAPHLQNTRVRMKFSPPHRRHHRTARVCWLYRVFDDFVVAVVHSTRNHPSQQSHTHTHTHPKFTYTLYPIYTLHYTYLVNPFQRHLKGNLLGGSVCMVLIGFFFLGTR